MSGNAMSMPTAAFLDTSVFDGQQYNYSSTALSTFVPACKKRGLKILLPDPTEREVRRHIRERSEQALKALDDARRKAPFLAKWSHFPKAGARAGWEVNHIEAREWDSFIAQFTVVKLGYSTLDMRTVMNWYDHGEAPFREGKKRKEFPDAFAIALVDDYARKNACYVAVVSDDPDFKQACMRFPSLLYFKKLDDLTELLLSEDGLVAELQVAIQSGLSIIEEAVNASLELYFSGSSAFLVGENSMKNKPAHGATGNIGNKSDRIHG